MATESDANEEGQPAAVKEDHDDTTPAAPSAPEKILQPEELDSLVDVADMPDVQNHAVISYSEKAKASAVTPSADEFKRDENGNVLLNKDGTPKKKRGRKAGQKTGQTSQSMANVPGKTPLAEPFDENSCRASAAVTTVLTSTCVALWAGEHHKFIKGKESIDAYGFDEIELWNESYFEVFKQYGIVKVPPLIQLGFCAIATVAAHAARPIPPEKKKPGVFAKVKLWWQYRKLQKAGKKPAVRVMRESNQVTIKENSEEHNGSQPDSGADGEREIHVGQAAR